jgi:hypothetical protein
MRSRRRIEDFIEVGRREVQDGSSANNASLGRGPENLTAARAESA